MSSATVAEDLNALTPVEVEIDGRTLTGVGMTADELADGLDRTPTPAPDAEPATEPVTTERNADGTFKKAKEPKGRERYSDLTAARDEALRLAKEREDEVARVKAELEQARKTAQPAPQATNGNGNGHEPARASITAPVAPGRPKPTIDGIGTIYPTHEDFVEDLADWKAEQRFNQAAGQYEQQIREKVAQLLAADFQRRQFEQQTDRTTRDAVTERGRQKYPDFEDVIKANSVEMPWPLISKIANHPRSEDLQYALAKDSPRLELIVDVFNRDPVAADALLGLALPSGAAASPASTARTGSTTNAPAPYQPVGSGTKTTVPPLDKLADDHGDDFDSSGYRERRAAERKSQR